MVYMVSTRNYIGDHKTIVIHNSNGYEEPVLHLIPGTHDFPGDKQALATNLVSLMNGNTPLLPVGAGEEQVFWARNENGFEFRTRTQSGLTKTSLIGAWDAHFIDRSIDVADILPALCEAIRQEKGKATKPYSKPTFSKS